MAEVELSFIFQAFRGEQPINNNNIYQFRKALSEALERSHFGKSIEKDGKFENQYAIPSVNEFTDWSNELIITIPIVFPPEDENTCDLASFLTNEIPELRRMALNQHISPFFRFTFF